LIIEIITTCLFWSAYSGCGDETLTIYLLDDRNFPMTTAYAGCLEKIVTWCAIWEKDSARIWISPDGRYNLWEAMQDAKAGVRTMKIQYN